MKMKTFSILLTLVCIGFVLMLAGDSVAQTKVEFVAEVESIVEERTYEVGDTTPLTITLRRGGQVLRNEPVVFSVIGLVDENLREFPNQPRDPTVASVDPAMGFTNDSGQIKTEVTFHRKGRIGIEVEATNLDSLYVHGFLVAVDEAITRIVASPVKTLMPKPVAVDTLAVGDPFTYLIEIKDVIDLAAWQMDIAYNPAVLELVKVTEGDFLAPGDAPGDVNAAFQYATMGEGKIRAWQARVGRTNDDTLTDPVTGVDGSGELLSIEFKVKEFAEEALGLHNVHLSNSANFTAAKISPDVKSVTAVDTVPAEHSLFFLDATEGKKHQRIAYHIISNPVVVTHQYPREDVNRDGMVNIFDLVEVAGKLAPITEPKEPIRRLGEAAANSRADVNNDGFVNVMDLILVARHSNWGKDVEPVKIRDANDQVGEAPLSASVGQSADLTPAKIQGWIDLAQVEDDGSAIFDLGIANLERLLHATVPEETKLLLNYPNPFNPETWIPYQLAKATDVTVSIYSVNGALVRTLALGHQAAGVYQNKSQAAYWDGRNELGEQVASGVYFYTLTAGDFSATGKMLVRK